MYISKGILFFRTVQSVAVPMVSGIPVTDGVRELQNLLYYLLYYYGGIFFLSQKMDYHII